MYRRVPDTTKVRELIGWKPTRTLEDIVGDVVACQRGIASPVVAVTNGLSAQ